MDNANKITYFAETDYRNKKTKFGIKDGDRTKHIYIIGKTGMGKSTLLENMAVQDIQNGNGMAFIDPHGKSAELLLDYVTEERKKDVLYFAPFDMEYPISFNVMEDVGHDKRHLVANGLMSSFKKIWVDAWSARMEYILNNIILALLEYPGSTLLGVNRMLADKNFRKKVVENVTDVSVKSFWEDEFAKYGERYMQEAGAAIQNKIGQFISNPLIRNIVGQPKSSFDFREMMDKKKIILVNLSKGRVGEANANLIGGMLITKIYLASMSRADVSEIKLKTLPNFYLYVDEFQSFANESFADILSEARKYKLNLTIAHQYIDQMVEEVRAAVFGNVGTMITFRVGANDADYLEKELAPEFTAEDLVNLNFAQIYLKLMIDGIGSRPFSARTIPPLVKPAVSYKNEIIEISREQFAESRQEVEKRIIEWHKEEKEEKQYKVKNPEIQKSIKQSGYDNRHFRNERNERLNNFDPRDKLQEYKNFKAERFNNKESLPNKKNFRPSYQSFQNSQQKFTPQDKPFKKAFQTEDNENELRKAMSLDYLKQKKEEEIKRRETLNKKKERSEENVSDLKNALGDILKEVKKVQDLPANRLTAQAGWQAGETKQEIEKTIKKENNFPANKFEEKKIYPVKSDEASSTQTKFLPKQTDNSVEEKTKESSFVPETIENKEVPREVLEKVLKIEK